ncbi:hypothetical protein UA08_07003 [Talaromyces atroroseus]|uniref:DNA-directed RNA polymerase III subunit RPC4 n=1 Tax=Talaromyces atroroseus TaxID=1441469 RepID=A0A225AA05_TALAT|nr:hypothetical protein UA08_07003 [Talaromyces atroroseus]OKL57761.1 hypothetical protein UA08_07003 [Talaromyces atroroseus]
MPPKAPGRGAPASRRPGVASTRDDEPGPEPANSSTAPAATSPSTRPQVQRLQSLNRRTPGGSIGPRGSGLGQQPKPVLKFQPRTSARRAKEERDALQKLEAERNRQRLSEAAAIQRAQLGRAARARGTFRGRGGTHGGFGGSKRGARFDSARPSISRYNTPTGGQSSADHSSDEDETTLSMNIEHINLDDDDSEDEVVKDRKGKKAIKSRSRRSGPRPIRVERHKHEERVVSVNTEASSTISAGLRSQDQEDEESDNELFLSEEPGTKVKREPTDGDVSMADLPHARAEFDETPLPPQTVKARKQVAIRDPRSLLQTKEEIDEYDRHLDDLETLKEILTPSERVPVKKAAEATENDDTEPKQAAKEEKEEEEEEEQPDKNDGRLFLIQFPPLTPNLVVPGVGEQGVVDLEDEIAQDVATGGNAGIGEPEVKREADEDEQEDKKRVTLEPPGKLLTATQRQIPAGRVGKLHLHKSGRVTLDWGGISFEMDKGASVNFVQEALIASTPATDEDGEERYVWAMGQLSEKFIASPEWDKLL